MEVYAIKVTLLGTSPPVWRRMLVPRDITLRNLHRTLQTVMGWTNSHLHQFVLQRQKFSDPRYRVGTKVADENRTTLGELIWTVGARLLYEYDFGDGWQHELLLEEVLLGDESFQQVCVAGKRCCPPEDCGGPQGFDELLEALQDANHPVTRTSLTGSAILFLNSSLQTKLTDDCAVGSIESGKSPIGGPEGFLRTVGISKIADLAPVKTCN